MKRALLVLFASACIGTASAAIPTILVDSTNGAASDFATSGAGPTTALTGTTVVTDATGLIVTLGGSPNLTGVAVDGSHVLFMQNNNAGKRNFGRITAKDGSLTSTASVTVDAAFDLNISSTIIWAIGGVRATVFSTTSYKILGNNAAAGDGDGGWIIEMQSGHVEPSTTSINILVSGSVAKGAFILTGKLTAAVRPILTFSNNGAALAINNNRSGIILSSFTMVNTNVTKTASVAVTCNNATNNSVVLRGLKIADSTNKFWKGFTTSTVGDIVEMCEIAYTADRALDLSINGQLIRFNYIHDTGTFGIAVSGTGGGSLIEGNLITRTGSDCIRDGGTTAARNIAGLIIKNNTLDQCSGDGFESTMTNAQFTLANSVIENNIFSNSTGGYGINFSGTGGTDAQLGFLQTVIRNNNFYNNSSGAFFPTTLTTPTNSQTVDPQFINTAGTNYGIGPNLKAKGFLDATTSIGMSNTYTFIDIGAAQRQETGIGFAYAQ